MLRARFDEHKNEKDMVKATRLLKAAEEEFWANQHPQPYLFPDSPGGTSYERYECYKVESAPGGCGAETWAITPSGSFKEFVEKSSQRHTVLFVWEESTLSALSIIAVLVGYHEDVCELMYAEGGG